MEKTAVMVNGLPGKMAKLIANKIITQHSDKYELYHSALTGPNQASSIRLAENTDIDLIGPERHKEFLEGLYEDVDFIIDFAKGEGVADRNTKLYTDNRKSFVMGTTGADYNLIEKMAEETKTPCVAFPNMDGEIVAIMDAIGYMAKNYMGVFKEAKVELVETHQADKINKETGAPETSGTMKSMLLNLGALTNRVVSIGEILSERDPIRQASYLSVPEEWIGWHAYHFFTLSREHDGVEDLIKITIKRHGGECYRIGTMKALDFLVQGKNKNYYNTMYDVLKR